MNQNTDFIIIGASILDVLAQPVTAEVFDTGSAAAGHTVMHTGGDALNETMVLAALGASVRLVSRTGTDYAGNYIQDRCRLAKIDTSFLKQDDSLETGINLVLVDDSGERHFITSQNGSLRKLCPADIPDAALRGGKYLCFASIFVFPAFDDAALARLFSRAKAEGLILCADMTKRKNGETLQDMKNSLSYLDYIFPNHDEASLLTGFTDEDEIADAFLSCGVGCVVLKAGAGGCFIKTNTQRYRIPAYPHARCLDTTGAGDTFTACFLDALNRGMGLPECGRFANAGASFCIERMGASGGIKSRSQVTERYLAMQDEHDCNREGSPTKKRTKEILAVLDRQYGTEYVCYLNYETPWQLLIATMLSAQCTDARVNMVTKDLFQKYATVDAFAEADLGELEQDIKSTGFYHNKAKNIIACMQALRDRFGGEVPRSLEDLTSLAGVGRKTANVIRGNIYHDASVVVDTHVKRISNRLGLTNHSEPEKIEQDLMKELPKDHWILYNIQIITFGRSICTARNPKCGECLLTKYCTERGQSPH